MYKVIKRDCPMFGIGPYLCEYVCDTTSDISTLPTFSSEGTGGRTAYDNQKCASGSRAIVAENGSESKQYMLNNQDIWCPYSVAVGNSGGGSSESSITVDFALSGTSENPVANKVIVAALDDKADTTHTHSVNEIGADARGSAASALEEAKAYTDSEITHAITENQTAVEELEIALKNADTLNLEEAKIYTNTKIADSMSENQMAIEKLETNLKKADTLNLEEAKAYTNSEIANAMAENETAIETALKNKVNDNLLINPNFKINQRGITGTFSEVGGYFVDRWKLDSGTVTINSDGTITLNGTISQKLENTVADDIDHSLSQGVVSGTTTYTYEIISKKLSITGQNAVISWVKLEYGIIKTPFVPPDPASELLKCQRYCYCIRNQSETAAQLLGVGYAQSATELNVNVNFPSSMRTPPTVGIANSEKILYSKNGSVAATSVTAVARNGCMSPFNLITLKCTGTFDAGTVYQIFVAPGGIIEFSAEL